MKRVFIPQRDALAENERLTDEQVAELNRQARRRETFMREFGVDFPKSGAVEAREGAPRLFTMKNGEVTPLADSGVQVGSKEFWELAMMGQVFGYKLGAKNPCQIQAWMGKSGPKMDTSEALNPEKEPTEEPEPQKIAPAPHPGEPPKKPEGGFRHPVEPVEPEKPGDPPDEVPEPSGLTKFLAFFGGPKSRQQVNAYRKYVDELDRYDQEVEAYNEAYDQYKKAHDQYETDVDEYDDQVKATREYAKALDSYERGQKKAALNEELYQYNKETWDAQHKTVEQDKKAWKQCAQTLQEKFGAQRTEETLKAEKQEADVKGNVASAVGSADHVRDGIEGMLSVCGAKPYIREDWLEDGGGYYKPSDFANLPEIKIDGFSVGGKPLSNEEFGALAMFAAVNPEAAKRNATRALPPIRDLNAAAEAYRQQGYDEEVFNEAMLNSYYGTNTTDLMNFGTPRELLTNHIEECLLPARLDANNALVDYQHGKKRALAEILARAVDQADRDARITSGNNTASQAFNKVTMDMIGMLERDPDLMRLAKQSSDARENSIHSKHPDFYHAGSFEDKIACVKARAAQRELQQAALEAREKLARDQAGEALSPEEKKDCIRTILKDQLISSVYRNATETPAPEYKDLVHKIKTQESDMVAKHDDNIDLSGMTVTFRIGMNSFYNKRPEVLGMVSNPRAMDALGQQIDRLIEKDNLLALSPQDLKVQLRDSYHGKDLLKQVSNIAKQNAQPTQPTQPQQSQERQQNAALVH